MGAVQTTSQSLPGAGRGGDGGPTVQGPGGRRVSSGRGSLRSRKRESQPARRRRSGSWWGKRYDPGARNELIHRTGADYGGKLTTAGRNEEKPEQAPTTTHGEHAHAWTEKTPRTKWETDCLPATKVWVVPRRKETRRRRMATAMRGVRCATDGETNYGGWRVLKQERVGTATN